MKRYIKRWISFILFMCVFVQYPSEGVVMAADSGQKNIDIVGTASMNTYDVALRVGKTKQLVCNGTTGKMVWKSSNPKVATVDKKGLVKAIKQGKAMISVSGGNLIGSMTCKVGVSKKITTKQARRKIMAMKKTYKEGLSWTNENRQYFWEATNCQCYGCIALCGEISDKVFGKYAPVTKHSNFSRIKAGDHIRIGNEHSVMVLQKNGNTLTVVEGNYNATVHWGRGYSKQFFKCLAQMKFVIKSIVQCDFPQGGFRLGKKKLTNHFQFGFHLEGGKSFSAGLMEPIV